MHLKDNKKIKNCEFYYTTVEQTDRIKALQWQSVCSLGSLEAMRLTAV